LTTGAVDEATEVLGEEHRGIIDVSSDQSGKNFPGTSVGAPGTPGYGTHLPNMGWQIPYTLRLWNEAYALPVDRPFTMSLRLNIAEEHGGEARSCKSVEDT